MTTQIKLLTSQDIFQQLHELVQYNRKKTTVPTQVLTNLLIDYSVMLAALSKISGFVIKDARERPRLEQLNRSNHE